MGSPRPGDKDCTLSTTGSCAMLKASNIRLTAILSTCLELGHYYRSARGHLYIQHGLLTSPHRYNVTVRFADLVVLLYDAEMVAVVERTTMFVVTVKVAVVAPAGTVTLEGTLAAALLLERRTCAPPAGAGPFSVTVPVDDPSGPPITLVGFRVSEDTTGGSTVSVAVCVPPPNDAEMVTVVDVATALVLSVKVAVVAPAGTVTLRGTLAAALLLESRTCAPPAGAGPLSVTVPVGEDVAPVTLVGLKVSAEGTGGSTVSEADMLAPP